MAVDSSVGTLCRTILHHHLNFHWGCIVPSYARTNLRLLIGLPAGTAVIVTVGGIAVVEAVGIIVEVVAALMAELMAQVV